MRLEPAEVRDPVTKYRCGGDCFCSIITPMHAHLLHNDEVQEASRKSASAGQTGLMNGWGVFTTIRVCDGVLFAWRRHWERMKRDAARLRVPFPAAPERMLDGIGRLIEANSAMNATLRIAVVRNHGGTFEGPGIDRDYDIFAFTADLAEWGGRARLGVKRNARHAASEFAGVKVTSWAFNLAWYEEAHAAGWDEYVLLNEREEVSECTSANLFAVFGQTAVTPPLESGCLPGVTRALLLDEVRAEGIDCREQILLLEDLERADGVFMTSSTRDVLPVETIDGLRIGRSQSVGAALGEAFARYRRRYVEESVGQPQQVAQTASGVSGT